MHLSEYETASRLVHEHNDLAKFVGRRDENLVLLAERAVGFSFPSTYRRFITEFGCLGFGSENIEGLLDDNFEKSVASNAIWMNLRERKLYDHPAHIYLIYSVGEGTRFALDLSRMDDNRECPVVAWSPGYSLIDDELEVVAQNFGEFFLDVVENVLKEESRRK